MRLRKKPEERKKELLQNAIELSIEHGYIYITREMLANYSNVSEALINNYFGTIDNLKSEIVLEAIKEEIPQIILQALVLNDPLAARITPKLRKKAARYLSK